MAGFRYQTGVSFTLCGWFGRRGRNRHVAFHGYDFARPCRCKAG
jgi:hypothetical protein